MAKVERIHAVSRAFTPGAPVDRLDMLAGRMDQLTDVVSAVSMRGQHVGLYGERGVGKTSLATVLAEYFSDSGLQQDVQSVVVNCGTNDTFDTLWTHIYAELDVVVDDAPISPESVR